MSERVNLDAVRGEGLFALGAHVSRGVARLLRAVEMLDR
jgi:hypothetical protein